MARGKKTDSNTKAKVIETKINNPDASSRDIAKELWNVSNDTVCDIINNDLPQVATQSQKITELVDRNDNLMSLADKRLAELLINPDEVIKASELVSIRDSAFKQNAVIGLKWWDDKKSITEITIQL